MNIKVCFILSFLFPIFLPLKAQKNLVTESTWRTDIKVDGELSEWGDSLSHYFKEQDIYYSFANDGEYLYVAIRVENQDRQVQAVFNGFNIQVNSDGKKREGSMLIFPLPDRAALRALSNEEFKENTNVRVGALSTVRAYFVKNYPTILNGPISLENNYGIQASVKIDSADHLCYESAIRLDQLKLKPTQGSFAINIKINGIIKTEVTAYEPANSYRRNPYNYGGYNPYANRSRTYIQNKEEPGIWQILQLATKPN